MTEMQQGLMIAAIGMGLVFVVIIFLWGLMALMMRLTSGKQRPEAETPLPETTEAPLVPEMQMAEGQRRAVAAGVAVQLALAGDRKANRKADATGAAGGLSPWQAAHRARQIEPKHTRG